MTCGTITFHRAANYGAILQSFALVKKINDLGINCEVIDYRGDFIENYYNPLRLWLFPKNWKRLAGYIIGNGNLLPNAERYTSFLEKRNVIGDAPVDTLNELKELSNKYDFIITGSDQVWSLNAAGFDSAYFLSFLDDRNKKRSYAASFGMKAIPDKYKEEYTRRLENFYNYSVRENDAEKIIDDLIGCKATVDLDPTLLINGSEWLETIDIKNVRLNIKKMNRYLLLYTIAESNDIISLAKRISKKLGLDVYYINDRWKKSRKCRNLSHINIDEWLYLMGNADFILTDSFHGTAFSVNFQKNFFSYQYKNSSKNSRITTLLRNVGLSHRIINNKTTDTDLENLGFSVDYPESANLLNALRTKSINNLKEIING